jgi:hypothetical protein
MKTFPLQITWACALALLAACGSDSTTSTIDTSSTARGTLVENPPFRIASLSATDLQAQLAASAFAPFLPLTGTPTCGVDFNYMHYWTVGGTGGPAEVSGALMVPTGASPQCSGPRPILLYAHGTQVAKGVNIADPTDPSNQEGILVAAMFAAQGYIVVAPNYVGYDSSTAAYHPYLNVDAETKDMIDALTAARKALGQVLASATTDNGRLFITGYSQGGHVAMATQKAMQVAKMVVTAAAPMSGPYALEAFVDFVFTGHVSIYSTLFAPMLVTSYQNTYGNAYGYPGATIKTVSDFYESAYAPTIEGLLPSYTAVDGPSGLIAQGKIPALALFSDTAPPPTGDATLDSELKVPTVPPFSLGFGPGNLIKNDVRVQYVSDALLNPDHALIPGTMDYSPADSPAYPLRKDLHANDLRDWFPAAPVLLCGGFNDPVVFYHVNTDVMSAWWQTHGVPVVDAAAAVPSLVTVLDLEEQLDPSNPFAPAGAGFRLTINNLKTDAYSTAYADWLAAHPGDTAGADAAGQQAAGSAFLQNYHQTVEPFCQAAVRGFFASIP